MNNVQFQSKICLFIFTDNQGSQKSPKIIKNYVGQQVQNINAKNLQKSEINHYTKKNTSIPQQSFGAKAPGQLSQVESTQSIKTSPVKNDNIGQKQYPHSIQKTSINKAQSNSQFRDRLINNFFIEIKIGMHKKAASMMGASHTTTQPPTYQQTMTDQNFIDYQRNINGIINMNSKVQSYIPSSQTSFNDYNSTSNNYQEVRVFPKVDNLIIHDLGGSHVLSQQQQMKSLSKILQESQLSQQNFEQAAFNQDRQMQSFEQKSSNAQSSHQSQRLSIISDNQQQQMINPGYRSHANSFKSTTSNNIAMKHPTSKYIKGGNGASTVLAETSTVNTATYLQGTKNLNPINQSKKTLQYHHQRTFSDNQAANNSRAQLFNANATGQVVKRNFQDLIKSVNNKEHMNDNFINLVGLNTTHNNTQDFYPVSLNTIGNSNIGNSGKGTKSSVGSTRQSAQGQVMMDEKDLLKHFQDNIMIHEPDDFSAHYNAASFKDQFQKTKQALKMTQQQFGGPSRKVVQNRLNGNANTQSFRVNTQQTLAGTSIIKNTINTKESKLTPKQSISKSSKQSYNQSQNVSAHGVRQSSNYINGTQQQQVLQSEKIKKQKPLTQSQQQNFYPLGSQGGTNITISQVIGDINFHNMHQKPTVHNNNGIQVLQNHKRTLSDSNHILLSLSNRSHIYQQSLDQYNQIIKGTAGGGSLGNNSNIIQQNYNLVNPQTDMIKTAVGGYIKQQSLTKIHNHNQPIVYQNFGGKNFSQVNPINEYQITSDRTQYNQSTVISSNNNVVIHSHRKISAEAKNNIGKYRSDQVSLEDDKIGSKQSIAKNKKSLISKQTIQLQKSQKDIIHPTHHNNNKNNQVMMIIQDQDFFGQQMNQVQQKKKANKTERLSERDENVYTPSKSIGPEKKINSIQIQQNQLPTIQLKVVEERIETQESLATDPNLTPRSRMNFKIHKKIKLAFQKAQATNGQQFQTSTEFYKIGKVMGKGAFGKVNLAIHRLSNKFVALKSINKQFLSEEASKKKVMQEFNILRRTRHFNIVRLYESFETQQHIVFVMEVCGSGDLLTYVRRRRKLKEDVAKHMFKQIIEGLKYCHSKNILHRDIKLDNILLTSEGDIKICDFGVSKLVRPGEIMTEQCGTPAYIAPEVFENRGYEGYASDVWSAGVVLYAMLYGTVPFKANNMTELQKQITKCQTTFKEEISQESINLLKGILERDPQKRLKISEILKHPWMQDIPSKVSVFTDQEKDKIIQEFAYYNFKNDIHDNDNGSGEVVHTDPFTEQMLNSTQNSLIKNASTKSVILAPFNSTRSHIDDEFHLKKSIQELLIDKKNIKFAAKVKEIDRQYEANNNAELDNGVYHQDSEEEKKEDDENKKDNDNKNNSIETSFDKDNEDDNDDDNDDNYGVNEMNDQKQNKKKASKQKQQSEWQKIEQMVIERQRTEEEEEESEFNKTHKSILETHAPIVINESIIQEIEKNGFPRYYIVNSLNNDDLNYATTYYYLLTIQKEF